ncbi:MAG TPA: hypothetical protein VGI23_06170 [Steroidobacteraceae bacterium]
MPGVLVFAVLRNAYAIGAHDRANEVKMIDGMGNNGWLARNPEDEVEASGHGEHPIASPAIHPSFMVVGDIRTQIFVNANGAA